MKKLFLMLIALVLLVSCSGSGSKKAFEDYMNVLKSGDVKKISEYQEKNGNGKLNVKDFGEMNFMLESFKKTDYKVLEVKEEKDKSVIKVKIKAPNLGEYAPEIFMDLMSLAFSGGEEKDGGKLLNDKFNEVLKSKDLKYINEEVSVNMIKRDGKWVLDIENAENDEFFSVLLGKIDKIGSALSE